LANDLALAGESYLAWCDYRVRCPGMLFDALRHLPNRNVPAEPKVMSTWFSDRILVVG
jgi:hypothetical protein